MADHQHGIVRSRVGQPDRLPRRSGRHRLCRQASGQTILGPYTDDFSTIYLEVGNEEWGTQQVPADTAYGAWAHFVISNAIAGKSYFNASKIKFIANGFDLLPSLGSASRGRSGNLGGRCGALYPGRPDADRGRVLSVGSDPGSGQQWTHHRRHLRATAVGCDQGTELHLGLVRAGTGIGYAGSSGRHIAGRRYRSHRRQSLCLLARLRMR